MSYNEPAQESLGIILLSAVGAKGDGVIYRQATIAASSKSLTCSSSLPASAVGKTIHVRGAGSAGGMLRTTIVSVSLGVATLADAAVTTTTGLYWQQALVGTDDTAAVQAAVAGLSEGQTLSVPKGIYLIASALSLDLKGSVSVIGQGYNVQSEDSSSPLFLFTAATGNLLTAKSAIGVEIARIGFGYWDAAYSGNLLDLQQGSGLNTSEIHVHDCVIGGLSGVLKSPTGGTDGAQAGPAAALIFLGGPCYGVTIERCKLHNAQVAIQGPLYNYFWANGIRIKECIFEGGFAKAPLQISGEAWAVEDCIFEPFNNNVAGGRTAGGIAVVSLPTLAAAGAISHLSPNITMGVANPGWVLPGVLVYDVTTGQSLGFVQSYVGTALVLAANAIYDGSGSSDALLFGLSAINGLKITGCVFLDALSQAANWTSICIDLEQSRDVLGVAITGNNFSFGGTAIRLNTVGHTSGVAITGNAFESFRNAIAFATGPNAVTGMLANGNSYASVVNYTAGAYAAWGSTWDQVDSVVASRSPITFNYGQLWLGDGGFFDKSTAARGSAGASAWGRIIVEKGAWTGSSDRLSACVQAGSAYQWVDLPLGAYASVSLNGQNAAKTATALQFGGAVLPAGLYRVDYVHTVVNASAGASQLTIGWKDAYSLTRTALGTSLNTGIADMTQGSVFVKTDGVHDLTYAFTLSGAPTAQVALEIVVTRMG